MRKKFDLPGAVVLLSRVRVLVDEEAQQVYCVGVEEDSFGSVDLEAGMCSPEGGKSAFPLLRGLLVALDESRAEGWPLHVSPRVSCQFFEFVDLVGRDLFADYY